MLYYNCPCDVREKGEFLSQHHNNGSLALGAAVDLASTSKGTINI